MITWFQRVFGKHHKYILMSFLVIMLFSFIVGIGAVPRGAINARRQTQRMFLGVDLNDQRQMQAIGQAAKETLVYFYRRQDATQQELNVFIINRIVLMHLADEWQLPDPTEKQIETYIRTLPAFLNADGTFDSDTYIKFRDQVQSAPAADRDFIVNTLAENCRLDRARLILGGPGYALPYVAQFRLGLEQMKYDLDAATLDYAKFEPKITDNLAALQELFNKTPDRFQQQPQVRASFVKFAAPAIGDPTPNQLSAFLTAHQNQFANVKPDNLGEQAAAITAAWRKNETAQTAGAQAMKFAREFFDLNGARNTPAFDALLKKYNVTLQSLPLLTRGTAAPATSPIPNDTLQEVAFSLDSQRTFSSPVLVPDGAAILFFDEGFPARALTLTEALPDVAAAYKEQEKERQFNARGEELRAAIIKDLAAGKTFAASATAHGLTVKNYPSVSGEEIEKATLDFPVDAAGKAVAGSALASMGRDLLMALANPGGAGVPFLLTLKPGEVSPMLTVPDKGVIFHVAKREPATLAANSPEVQRVLKMLSAQESAMDSGLILARIVEAAQATLKQTSPTPAGS